MPFSGSWRPTITFRTSCIISMTILWLALPNLCHLILISLPPHTSHTTMSPWTAKPIATSIGGYGFFSLGAGMPSYQTPMGREHQIWSFSLMLLEVLAMASSMQVIGLLTPSLQNRSIQWKELYPNVLSCLLWGDQWSEVKLLFTATIKQ